MADGNLYIAPWAPNVTTETNWYTFLANRRDRRRGYAVEFKRANNVVRVIYNMYEAALRPGWHASFAADRKSVSAATSGGANYYSFANDVAYIEWDVPATAAGSNRLDVYFFGVASSASLAVYRNYGQASQELLGTVSTAPATGARSKATLTLPDPLVEGDTLRVIRHEAEGTARLHGIVAYDDGAGWTPGRQMVLPGTWTSIHLATTAVEGAYGLSPDGQGAKWIGGTHSGGGTNNCTEANISETWEADGSPFTPAAGYTRGLITLHRVSDVSYDVSNPAIATLTTDYEFDGESLEVGTSIELNQTCDTGSLYPVQAAALGAAVIVNNVRYAIDAGDDSDLELPATATQVRLLDTPGEADTQIVVEAVSISHAVERVHCWQRATGPKIYWTIDPGDDLPAGTTWGGSWRLYATAALTNVIAPGITNGTVAKAVRPGIHNGVI